MKITFYKGKKRFYLGVKKCGFFGKFLGLMFSRRKTAKALIFYFKNPCRKAIHSFFCTRFLAVWLDKENNVLEKRIVKPFTSLVLPKRKFSKLIEIPLNERYSKIIETLFE